MFMADFIQSAIFCALNNIKYHQNTFIFDISNAKIKMK